MLRTFIFCFVLRLCVFSLVGGANVKSKLPNDIRIQAATFPVAEFKENYLKQWAKKYTELSEIPKCQDIPTESEEEKEIGKRCSPRDKNWICMNISLFNVVRKLCSPYLNNIDKLRGGANEIIGRIGVDEFKNADFGKMMRKLEKNTKTKLSNFLKRDILDLFADAIKNLPLPQ